MFHTSAFTMLLGTVADTDVPALSDQIIQIQNNHFILPRDMKLYYALAMSATLNRSRFNSPSLRQLAPTYIDPISITTLPPTDPNVSDWRANPLTLRGQEEIQNEATSDIAMGTERYTCVMGLGDRIEPAPIGDIITLRATSTTAAVVNVWTPVSLTWTNFLPVGTYCVIGARHVSTNGQAFRLTFDDQWMRPGGLSFATLGLRSHDMFRKGGLGRWGLFRTISLPRAEVLCNVADAVHTFYVDVVRIAA